VSNELAAVVSAVPLTDYSDEALQARLLDATWIAVKAVRHETVIEYFAARASIIPLRFGTIYLQRARIEQMLSERSTELRVIIERLRGQEEWSINIFCNHAKLMESITSLSPRLRELNEQAASASPGQSYLMRKKIDAMRADETHAEIKHVIANIEQALASVSNNVARLRVHEAETTEHGELVAKRAFLVAREHFSEFRAAAERVAQEYGASGIKLELTGPWPAYNFAGE
jgi:hypothetical protein